MRSVPPPHFQQHEGLLSRAALGLSWACLAWALDVSHAVRQQSAGVRSQRESESPAARRRPSARCSEGPPIASDAVAGTLVLSAAGGLTLGCRSMRRSEQARLGLCEAQAR
ncbi:hypothetical protein FA09DRAFT_241882 [Tilletiopsis washingtonensis]|uniref:Uncharacterized protein n=1 Tax=Tilletiopsis washingtonensis TaxID=58919 RepID=A0A316ZC28_9BASI|nr:hypothetical protein FA09DRAFT_241882 [Tilletiopsis washingtonensis]PWN99101.1 hypothetical protein FA09DRAFT_241882 [Tilletiopsis washingtonensis]